VPRQEDSPIYHRQVSPKERTRFLITECEDLLGNPLESVITWSFVTDYTPPVITNVYPVCGDDDVPEIAPNIVFRISDRIAGLDTLSVSVRIIVNGTLRSTIDLSSPLLSLASDSVFHINYGNAWL
jgi:hypothetical protein